MLFPSPRYGAEAITKLIEQVDSNIMLTPFDPLFVTNEVLERRTMRTFAIPSLETLWTTKSQPYPFTKTFEQHNHEFFATLHTSGTTGFPKPIIWTHDWANSVLQYFNIPHEYNGFRISRHFEGPNKRIVFPFPAFHTSGLFGQLIFTLGTGATVILPPSGPTPAASVVLLVETLEFLRDEHKSKVHIMAAPPPHVEYLAQHAELLDRVTDTVECVMYGGSGISDFAGTTWSKKIRFFNDIGSTELGLWPSLERLESDLWNGEKVDDLWNYTPIHPALNINFRPVGVSSDEMEICEAVMLRNEDGEGFVQPLFKIYTQDKERSLGDLFVRHPRHKELWKHYGRADELLNFSTAEKFHPAAAERFLCASVGIGEAMIVGMGRPFGALILRLEEGKTVEDIWSGVEQVNENSPVYARVTRDMVLVVEEPFLRTPKGSVRKKAILEVYQEELDRMYKKALAK
jgi:acyl-coenzyme A synthetase/AMP-(fatty) acid ligase